MAFAPGGRLLGCLWLGGNVDSHGLTLDQEQLKREYEASIRSNDGKLILHGLFARANAVNNNNRVYPRRILRREVARFVKNRLASDTALGELDHPSYASPVFKYLNLANVSHQVLWLEWRGNCLYGAIHVLDTPCGHMVQQLYRQGFHVGVSSRGWASVQRHERRNHNTIMEDFELITFDFVTEPSTKGAYLRPLPSRFVGAVPQQAKVASIAAFGLGAVPMQTVHLLPHPQEFSGKAQEFAEAVRAEGCVAIPAGADAEGGHGATAEQTALAAGTRSEPLSLEDVVGAEPRPQAGSCAMIRPAVLRAPFHAFQGLDDAWVCYGSYVTDVHMYGLPAAKGMRDLHLHMAEFAARCKKVSLHHAGHTPQPQAHARELPPVPLPASMQDYAAPRGGAGAAATTRPEGCLPETGEFNARLPSLEPAQSLSNSLLRSSCSSRWTKKVVPEQQQHQGPGMAGGDLIAAAWDGQAARLGAAGG